MRRNPPTSFLTAERRFSPLYTLALVAAFGVIAGSLGLTGPVKRHALTAQAVAPAGGTKNTEKVDETSKTCEDAKKKAAEEAQKNPYRLPGGGIQKSTGKEIDDRCIAALPKDTSTADAPKPTDPEHYKCVGKQVRIKVAANKEISELWEPERALSPGTCNVTACESTGTCITIRGLAGLDSKKIGEYMNTGSATYRLAERENLAATFSIHPNTGMIDTPPKYQSENTVLNSVYGPAETKEIFAGKTAVVEPFSEIEKRAATPVATAFPPPSDLDPGPGPTVPKGDIAQLSPGAERNPWLNGALKNNSEMYNNPEGLTPVTSTFDSPKDISSIRAASPGSVIPGDVPFNTTALDPKIAEACNGNSFAACQSVLSKGGWAGELKSEPWLEAPKPPQKETGVDPAGEQYGVEKYCEQNPSACTKAPPELERETCKPGQSCYVDPKTGKPPPQQPPTQPPPGGPQGPSGPGTGTSGVPSGGIPSALTSLLNGFARGLGGALAQQQGQAQQCPTDPNQYAQYQQQYNQQLQQYNYQLQQHNYQQQVGSYYGYNNYYASPPVPPRPCSSSGSTANQCPTLSVQPPASSCTAGTWRQMTTTGVSGSVCPQWQCVPDGSQTPIAEISCEPKSAVSGMSIAISFRCANATTSAGSGDGFSTGGSPSGTREVMLNPPESASTANFSIKCTHQSVSASAECSVKIVKPSITLTANPPEVAKGATTTVGYVTTGMTSCIVSSPDMPDFTEHNADRTNVNAVVATPRIMKDTRVILRCMTQSGTEKTESITIKLAPPGSGDDATVNSSIDGKDRIALGTQVNIQWDFPHAPDRSAVSLWLVYENEEASTPFALIAGQRAKKGTYTWHIPRQSDPCDQDSALVCASDLLPGAVYSIEAALYTPPNAYLGKETDSNAPDPEYIGRAFGVPFRMR